MLTRSDPPGQGGVSPLMTNDPRSFGEMLRTYRVSTGLTQQELGGRAGVSVRGVRDIEHGRVRRPRDESVRRLARVLGLDPAEALAVSHRGAAGSTRPAVRPPDLLHVAVLGPLRVQRGGKQVPLGSLKQRCLLGLLALNADRVVGHQEIVDALWGERPPAASRNLIHTYVARLRRVLAPGDAPAAMSAIMAVRGGYQLRADGTRLDLTRFDESATQARDLRATDPKRHSSCTRGRWEPGAGRCWPTSPTGCSTTLPQLRRRTGA
jgi:transcriptional regulator with XRE-family HTH domain